MSQGRLPGGVGFPRRFEEWGRPSLRENEGGHPGSQQFLFIEREKGGFQDGPQSAPSIELVLRVRPCPFHRQPSRQPLRPRVPICRQEWSPREARVTLVEHGPAPHLQCGAAGSGARSRGGGGGLPRPPSPAGPSSLHPPASTFTPLRPPPQLGTAARATPRPGLAISQPGMPVPGAKALGPFFLPG